VSDASALSTLMSPSGACSTERMNGRVVARQRVEHGAHAEAHLEVEYLSGHLHCREEREHEEAEQQAGEDLSEQGAYQCRGAHVADLLAHTFGEQERHRHRQGHPHSHRNGRGVERRADHGPGSGPDEDEAEPDEDGGFDLELHDPVSRSTAQGYRPSVRYRR
jgi:hypothetical protein